MHFSDINFLLVAVIVFTVVLGMIAWHAGATFRLRAMSWAVREMGVRRQEAAPEEQVPAPTEQELAAKPDYTFAIQLLRSADTLSTVGMTMLGLAILLTFLSI